MKSFLTLRSVDEILELQQTFSVIDAEHVELDEACGRYLAEDILASHDLPGFDRSTVDGYAVRARDVFGANESSPALLQCIGSCPMGSAPELVINEGQTARILTGGMLPQGADSVVMVEYSRPAEGGLVEIIRTQAPGDNVLMRDEDACRGQLLISSGSRLRPQEIGLLAAFGIRAVPVRRAPRVVIISTGDEVVPLEQTPEPGQIRDVNSYSLAALCREAGACVRMGGLVRDEPARLKEIIDKAVSGERSTEHTLPPSPPADVVLVSGGSSAGMRDHTVEVFTSLRDSQLLAHGASISPGKPFILARTGKTCLMGLPGHVASALICARVFLLPLLRHLQGVQGYSSPSVRASLTRAVSSAQGRRDFIRVRLEPSPQGWLAEPILGSSGLISSLTTADALVICPENREGLYAGESIDAELLR